MHRQPKFFDQPCQRAEPPSDEHLARGLRFLTLPVKLSVTLLWMQPESVGRCNAVPFHWSAKFMPLMTMSSSARLFPAATNRHFSQRSHHVPATHQWRESLGRHTPWNRAHRHTICHVPRFPCVLWQEPPRSWCWEGHRPLCRTNWSWPQTLFA